MTFNHCHRGSLLSNRTVQPAEVCSHSYVDTLHASSGRYPSSSSCFRCQNQPTKPLGLSRTVRPRKLRTQSGRCPYPATPTNHPPPLPTLPTYSGMRAHGIIIKCWYFILAFKLAFCMLRK